MNGVTANTGQSSSNKISTPGLVAEAPLAVQAHNTTTLVAASPLATNLMSIVDK